MLFLSTYINKLDKKGRVSIPSSFRASLSGQDFSGVIVYESITNKCIEACSINRIKLISESIDELDPYSDERNAFATIILGGSVKLAFDSEGRIVLPESLISFAGLKDEVCFVGKGQVFEIWNQQEYKTYYAQAKTIALDKKNLLKLSKRSQG